MSPRAGGSRADAFHVETRQASFVVHRTLSLVPNIEDIIQTFTFNTNKYVVTIIYA